MRRIFFLFIAALITNCSPKLTYFKASPKKEEFTINNNKSKNDNYVLAYEYMIETFVDSESVIEFSDKEEGVISGKYNFDGSKKAVITVKVKNNSARITIASASELVYRKDSSGKKVSTDFGPTDYNEMLIRFKKRFKEKLLSNDDF